MKALPPGPKPKSHAEKWASAALALMSIFLLLYLARQTGIWAKARPASKPASSSSTADRDRQRKDDLARFDPEVKLDLLREYQSRPAPHFNRNPFEYPAPKVAPAPVAAPAAPPKPVAPPPPPLKAMGYMEKAGGMKEATVTDDTDNIYVVHEGEVFANHFKVLKISPTVIEIEDTSSQQSIQLPVPQ